MLAEGVRAKPPSMILRSRSLALGSGDSAGSDLGAGPVIDGTDRVRVMIANERKDRVCWPPRPARPRERPP